MFAEEKEWPVVCRYSSEPRDPGLDVRMNFVHFDPHYHTDATQDRIPQPRGFAMKVFDVHGEFFDVGKDIPTQDIGFNFTPALDLVLSDKDSELLALL
jgi:hypothetical protein